jgi:hypothetical protein
VAGIPLGGARYRFRKSPEVIDERSLFAEQRRDRPCQRNDGLLARFAATGDPNGSGEAPWLAYDAGENILQLDNSIVNLAGGYRNPQCDFLSTLPSFLEDGRECVAFGCALSAR